MSGLGLDLVTSHFPELSIPFERRHDWSLLIEVSGPVGIGDRVEQALADCFADELLLDAVIAQSETQRKSLWDLRENTPESNRAAGAFCNSDTSVPISKVDAFIARTFRAILQIDPNLRINSYGHIGDGNIHHNVMPPVGITKADFIAANPSIVEAVRMAINEATRHYNGSISAEHGIGRLKTLDMELYVERPKLDALKRIKSAFDPNNILNPGAIVS
jgi:FAD/FMN-containing dehydrogenase